MTHNLPGWMRSLGQFAEKYQQKSEVFACAKTYGTWNRIKREALPKNPSQAGP